MTDPAHFRDQAKQCRKLATDADDGTAANLLMLAAEFEAEAERVEGEPGGTGPKPRPAGKTER